MRKRTWWIPAHTMAAELAQWGMDANLVKTAESYMSQYPEASLEDWLERLVQLGELFKSSDQTVRYRQQLQEVCRRVGNQYTMRSGQDWAWVLGWAARLLPYYQADLDKARRRPFVKGFEVNKRIKTFRRETARGDEEELDIPKVREEVSGVAQKFFDMMQERSDSKEEN